MRIPLVKSLVMYFLAALFLATSCLPVHAHLASWHTHDDLGHEHQSSVHIHDAIDHTEPNNETGHHKAHELSVVNLGHDLAGLASIASVSISAVGKLADFPFTAKGRQLTPPGVAFAPPVLPVAHDSEPRAPPA